MPPCSDVNKKEGGMRDFKVLTYKKAVFKVTE